MENFKCIIIVFLSVIPATSSDLIGFSDVVFDGDRLILGCRFDRYYGSITWYRGDVDLGTSTYNNQNSCTKRNNSRYLLCPSYQLYITSVDYYLDKDIIWKCKQWERSYNEFTYTIKFGVPVRNILLNSNSDIRYEHVHARVGENLWFGCQITPVSHPISAQICAQDCFNISFDETGQQSNNTLLKVRSEMNRTAIYCTATYKEQVIRSSFKTIVLLEDIQNLDLKASSRPNDENNTVTIHEGDVINLICEALKAFPTPTIEIYIQSTNYNQSIVAKDTTKQLNYSLILTHEMNGAELSCKAVSGTMTAYAAQTILLLVLYAPRPSITSVNRLLSRNSVIKTNSGNLNNMATNNDGTVTLRCTADAQPSNLTFSPWQHYIGNELIREVQGIEEGDGKSYSLEVSTDLKDAGLYICTVSNGINRHNQTQQTARYLLNTVKAEFHSNTTNKVNGRVGDYVELYKIYTCPMDCNVTWYKDGTRDITSTIEYSRIPSYYNSTILIPSNKTVIKLTSIQLSDTATYTCNICNINGCINSSVELTVETTSRLESLESSDRQLVFGITGGAIVAIVILLIIIVVLVVILHRNKPVKKNPTKPEMEIMENALYQSADLDPTFTGNNTSNNNESGLVYAQVQKKTKTNENPTKPEMEIMENALYQSADLDPTFTGNNSNNNASGLVYAQVQKNSKKKDNNQISEAVYYNTTCDEVLYSNRDERL